MKIYQKSCIESGATADSSLFYNPMIHIGGKFFFDKQLLFDNNIRHGNDNIEEDGIFLCFDKFCDMYTDVKVIFFRICKHNQCYKDLDENVG